MEALFLLFSILQTLYCLNAVSCLPLFTGVSGAFSDQPWQAEHPQNELGSYSDDRAMQNPSFRLNTNSNNQQQGQRPTSSVYESMAALEDSAGNRWGSGSQRYPRLRTRSWLEENYFYNKRTGVKNRGPQYAIQNDPGRFDYPEGMHRSFSGVPGDEV